MPLDAVCLGALVREINEKASGGKIDKVYQPEREEIVLSIRTAGSTFKLMLTASASAPRMHFIDIARENPAAPPMFCMLMRKHLHGAKICSITQHNLERMAIIELDTTDEMGIPSKKYLVCEMMGKYSNIILCDNEKRIIDSIKRIDGDISGKRQVLPGLFYRLPPPQDKVDLFNISDAGIFAAVLNEDSEIQADRWLLSKFLGLSPIICREIVYRAFSQTSVNFSEMTKEQKESLGKIIITFVKYIKDNKMRPYLLVNKEQKTVFDFSYMPMMQYEGMIIAERIEDFSSLLAAFYEKKGKVERIKRRAQDITKTVTLARERLIKKLNTQRLELKKTYDRDKHKRKGELITANLYQIEKGANKVKVIDYYDENCAEIEITLDIRLAPQQNAAKYFKKYNKAKTAEEILTKQIAQGEQNLEYLESVLEEIEKAENEQDISQIREELYQTGYLSMKKQKGNKNNKKSVSGKPFEYKTTDGFSVFAGKNNIQNDLLTLKTAFKSDIWFHTQKIHGSHVILVCDGKEPTDEAMTQAAEIAAYHSQARTSNLVPVDYSEVRNIKKPNGAKPGMVIYHIYKTAFVTADEEKILKMRV